MLQRLLGNTGLKVSRLGLGTMTWGRDTDEHEARDQLIAFAEAGGTLLDTAAGYTDGDSERLIGSLIGDVVARDEIVLATKAGISRRSGERVTNTSRGHLLTALDASLARLGVDHVDLWQVHVWNDETPIEETLSALDLAVTSGRASYVGISQLQRLADRAGGDLAARRARGAPRWPRPRSSTPWSTASSSARCSRPHGPLGLGVLPWSPLGRGVLTGQVPRRDPVGLAWRLARLLRLRRGLPRRRQRPHRRGVSPAPPRASAGRPWRSRSSGCATARASPPRSSAPAPRPSCAARSSIEDKTLPPELLAALDDISKGAT